MSAREIVEAWALAVYLESSGFDAWFAGSKVTGSDGRPLRVYHGTPTPGFAEFSADKRGAEHGTAASKKAFWFSACPQTADFFSQRYGGGGTHPAYLAIKNPLVVDHSAYTSSELSGQGHSLRSDAIKRALRAGKDGVIFRNSYEAYGRCDIFAVFSPDQIRSSIGALPDPRIAQPAATAASNSASSASGMA